MYRLILKMVFTYLIYQSIKEHARGSPNMGPLVVPILLAAGFIHEYWWWNYDHNYPLAVKNSNNKSVKGIKQD